MYLAIFVNYCTVIINKNKELFEKDVTMYYTCYMGRKSIYVPSNCYFILGLTIHVALSSVLKAFLVVSLHVPLC